jgi:hypothetical protein
MQSPNLRHLGSCSWIATCVQANIAHVRLHLLSWCAGFIGALVIENALQVESLIRSLDNWKVINCYTYPHWLHVT